MRKKLWKILECLSFKKKNCLLIEVQLNIFLGKSAKILYFWKFCKWSSRIIKKQAASTEVVRLLHLKVRRHYAARQNATHCSFATRQKLLGICRQFDRVHMKKEFFADNTSGYKNCGTRPVNVVWFFSLSSWCHFKTPYSSYAARQTFDETAGILPIEFSCHMACCGMQKPCLSRAALTSTLFSPFAAWQGRILLHSAAQHSVDAP